MSDNEDNQDNQDNDKGYDNYYNANQDFDNYVGIGNYGGDIHSSDLKEQYYGWKTLNAEADRLFKKGGNKTSSSKKWIK